MVGEVVLADVWESSNTWSYALVNADCMRSTRNPLNTQPGSGIVRERQNGAFGSQHPGGANFCYADGHVQFVTDSIDTDVYRALSTIHDGLRNEADDPASERSRYRLRSESLRLK